MMQIAEDDAKHTVSQPSEKNFSPYAVFFLTLLFSSWNVSLLRLQDVFYLKGDNGSIFVPIVLLGGISPLTIISYMIFPISFFLLLYVLGERTDLTKQYLAVALSLFVGGASGSFVGALVGLYYQTHIVPSANSFVPLPLGLEPILVGLFAFYTGFSAIAISYFAKGDTT